MIPTPNHVIHDDSYLVFDPVEEWHAIRAEKAAKRREFWRNAAGIAITTALITAIVVLWWA